MKKQVIPIGDTVICDICNDDWTHRKESGGFLFVSKAVCPDCTPKVMALIDKHEEQSYIRGKCPEDMSFADWVRSLSDGPRQITITKW